MQTRYDHPYFRAFVIAAMWWPFICAVASGVLLTMAVNTPALSLDDLSVSMFTSVWWDALTFDLQFWRIVLLSALT